MRLKKIILSFCLILTIAFNQTYEVYADAGSLVVAGGAIGVAGVGVAGLTGPVVVAVFCAMMAMGMNIELTRASEDAGMTKTEFLKSKISQYCNEASISLDTFNNYILSESSILQNGAIQLGKNASAQIKKFCNWLFDSNQVSQNQGEFSGSTINLGGKTFPMLTEYTFTGSSSGKTFTITSSIPCAYGIFSRGYNNYYYIGLISNQYFNGTKKIDNVISNYNYDVRMNGYYYANFTSGEWLDVATAFPNLPVIDDSISTFVNSLDGTFNPSMDAPVADDTFTGTRDDYNTANPALDVDGANSTVINPGLIGQIPIPADKDLTWDVNSYLDALQKALDKVANPDVPAVDDATGLPVSIPIPDTIALDPDMTKVPDNEIPDTKTPIVDPSKEPSGEQAIDPLKFDLKNIFPFCLPWDIKDMLNLLKANPQAPSYHVDWHIPIVNTDLEFTVDLSPFNSVAAIARKMELLAFIVGLAVITRRMIRG